MEIYLTRDGAAHGPYDLPTVRGMLATGAVGPGDLGWTEAANDWRPLFEILPSPKIQQASTGSTVFSWIKRGIGALFFIGGLGYAFSVTRTTGTGNQIFLGLIALFCLSSGAWWMSGKAEPHPIPLRARLALIWSLLFVVLTLSFAALLGLLPSDLIQAPEAQRAALYIEIGLLILFVPVTLYWGHSGRAVIGGDHRFRGGGRCLVALVGGYLFAVLIGIDIYSRFTSDPVPAAEQSATKITPVSAPVKVPVPTATPIGPLYLKSRQIVKFDDGIRGFPRGTRVELIEDRGATVLVNADNHQIEVSWQDLTSDLALAESMITVDQRAQYEAHAKAQAFLEGERKAQAEEWAATQKRIAENQQRQTVAPVPVSPLSRPAFNQRTVIRRSGPAFIPSSPSTSDSANQAQYDRLKRAQEASLQSQINILKKPENFKVGDPDRWRLQDQLRNLQRNGQ